MNAVLMHKRTIMFLCLGSSALGLVALSCRLGCLDPNISSDSEQMRLIKLGREMFKALEGTEMNLHLWKYFPTKSYKTLKRTHQEFAE